MLIPFGMGLLIFVWFHFLNLTDIKPYFLTQFISSLSRFPKFDYISIMLKTHLIYDSEIGI